MRLPALRSLCGVFHQIRRSRIHVPPIQYISGLTDGDTSAPRIPKVYDYITSDYQKAYLVMEYIEAGHTPARHAPEKVAETLRWLRGLPAPPGVMIGPVGGGPTCHRIFKDLKTPLLFSSEEGTRTECVRVSHFPKRSPPTSPCASTRLSNRFRRQAGQKKTDLTTSSWYSPSRIRTRETSSSIHKGECAFSTSRRWDFYQSPSPATPCLQDTPLSSETFSNIRVDPPAPTRIRQVGLAQFCGYQAVRPSVRRPCV